MNLSADTAVMDHIDRIFQLQRDNRATLKASTATQRCVRLQKLRSAVLRHADAIDEALFLDLRKPRLGAQHFEITSVLGEIDDIIANLESWMKPEPVPLSPHFAGNQAYVMYEPRGVVALFGPWNFAFALVFQPLAEIIAAGNTCIVKPNEMQPNVSAITAKIIREVFDEKEVAVFEGGIPLAERLLELPFDHIFFTGSPAVGKRIMAAAAKHLTTVTLELGGKCPAIIDSGCDLAAAAGMAVGGRFPNAGQLCLSVDHVWIPEGTRDAFLQIAKDVIDQTFFVDGVLQRERIARIVDARNFARVKAYLDDALARGAKIAIGGEMDESDLTIYPTVLIDVPLDAKIMQEEIFGPLLPVFTYQSLDQVTRQIDATGKPLAMYIFSERQEFIDEVLLHSSSGGVTVNGMMLHAAEKNLPFGGCNTSGIGRCKGIHGFRDLSNGRSIFVADVK